MSGYCNLCGKLIATGGYQLRHPRWSPGRGMRICERCYRLSTRCRSCGMPLNGEPSREYCPTCLDNQPLCIGCGQPITSHYYYTINGRGPYCQNCRQQPPTCEVCGGPLGKDHWRLSDGRLYCDRCQRTTVNHPAEAARLYQQVQSWLADQLKLRLNVPTSLTLVDRHQLVLVMAEQSEEPVSPPDRTLGIYTRRGIKRGIYLQSGLPRALFRQVSAHELAHAWQGENCPLLRDALIREGFAEWIAYKCMQAHGETQQQQLMTLRNDIYGQGLRWALELERSHGTQAVIRACHLSQ